MQLLIHGKLVLPKLADGPKGWLGIDPRRAALLGDLGLGLSDPALKIIPNKIRTGWVLL